MARKSNAPPGPHVPVKPEFVSSPGFQSLEADVAKRRARDRGLGIEPGTFRSKTPRPIGMEIDDFRKRYGLTEEVSERIAQATADRYREELEALETTRREGRWKRLCPAEFRVPFERRLLPKEVRAGAVDEVLDWKFGPKGLWVIGASGYGKTRTMWQMLRREIVELNRTAVVMDGVEFSNACVAAFSDGSKTERFLQSLVQPAIFVIDDLAKRFTKSTAEAFFAVLDRRTARQRPLILTTNCDGKALEKMIADPQLSDPMRRRLRQFCETVIF